MKKKIYKVDNIPVILWGEKSDCAYVCVHGKHSNKEEAQSFAEKAISKGFQVLSFDLPEHGERKDEDYPCMVWNAVHDLGVIGKHARQNWNNLCLFGSSLGAYFSLLAYQDFPLKKSLFLSPVLDMEHLNTKMMKWFGISEKELEERREIPTPMGETLYWDYYCYARESPIGKWEAPTEILYGSEDNLTARDVAESFSKRFHCGLTVLEGSEHWFHAEWQLAFLDGWLDKHIGTV